MNVVFVTKVTKFGESGRTLVCRDEVTGERVVYQVPFGDPDGIVPMVIAHLTPGASKRDFKPADTLAHGAGKFPCYLFIGGVLINPSYKGDELLSPLRRAELKAKRDREIVDGRSPEERELDGPMVIKYIRDRVETRGAMISEGEVPEERKHEVDAALWKVASEREARIAARRKARVASTNNSDVVESLGL